MPAIQSTYEDRMRVAVEGLVANMETQNSKTRMCEEAAGIGFGQPVVQGVTDKGGLLPDSVAYAAVSAARAGNTGNGAITANPAVGAGVQEGVYTLTLIDEAANGGTFNVENPDGEAIGTADVGVQFVGGGLTFTVADGGVDFVGGDAFTITVTAQEGGGAFQGITIRDITLVRREAQTVDLYQEGDSMGLLDDGVIWVRAGVGGVVAGRQAFWDPATKRYTANPAHFLLPNVRFETSGASGDLVQLRVSAL